MDVNEILLEYDSMFGNTTLDKIEEYLYGKICEAIQAQEDGIIITLINEMIGLCRDTSQKEKAIVYCKQLEKLLVKMELVGTKDYATSMQNIANAYRAFGLWEEAEKAFEEIESTYEKFLDKGDYLWASMYNNWGLLYQEKKEFDKSSKVLLKALELISKIPDTKIKQAITKTNLANSLLGTGDFNDRSLGCSHLLEALDIFEQDGGRDFHYGAALVAMGDYKVSEDAWEEAKEYYQKGLVEILVHTGKTDSFYRVLEKYDSVKAKLQSLETWEGNLKKCEKFYLNKGKAMIHKEFPEYENRIAVGVVGEGSDCFGFDDKISTDHDYEVGLCMWLTKEDFDKIGNKLQEAYNDLIEQQGQVNLEKTYLGNRRGVFEIDEFFDSVCEEWKLAEKVNGVVFRDDLGLVTKKRDDLLKYYDEELWRKKLATLLHDFSGYGQSNYARMMARKDYITASLCINKTIEAAMDIVYVLNRTYAPYYKWKKRGIEKLENMQEVLWICEELASLPLQKNAWKCYEYSSLKINLEDKCVVLIETLAKVIVDELKKRELVSGRDSFLESYISQIL